MRKNAFTWWEMLIVLVILAIIAALLFPITGIGHPVAPRSTCQSYIKQIGLGIKQYVQDYNEKYPLVNSGQEGWMDILQPYLKSTQLFQCPSDNSGSVDGTTDYYYNARLAGQKEEKLEYIANTIMLGDGIGDSPSNVSLSKLPTEWASDQNSPAWRHLDGANYSYADGHVKWLKPTAVSNAKASSTVNTFAPW